MSLLTQASLVLTPNAYKANKMYSIIPLSGSGDMTTTRATTATRINSSGLVENVATGIPRVDYTGGVANILLEPQRTNLNTYSSTFTNASWFKSSMDATLNSVILSPDGTTNAYKISRNSVSSNSCYIGITSAPALSNTFVATVYARLGDVSTNIGLRLQSGVPDRGDALFNLSNGTLIGVHNGGTNTLTSGSIESVGNGWYRCSVTTTFLSSRTFVSILYSPTALTSLDAFEGADGALSNCYVWGSQMEVGSYATSYIPTTTSTVTRNNDIISRDNIYTNGLITSAGGTWFIELDNNFSLTRDIFSFGLFINTLNNSTGNGFNITSGAVGRFVISKNIAGVFQNLYLTLTDRVKIAIDWNGTTADVFVNGFKVVTATSFTTTNMNYFNANTTDVPKYIKSMILFPTPLTDAECISLTTL